MQDRITRRVGRFVRLLAGRPPVVPTDARHPRDRDLVAVRADSAVSPLAAGNALPPQPNPVARRPAIADTLPLRTNPAAGPPATAETASGPDVTARPALRGRLAASAALLGMLLLCLAACLMAAWRQLDGLAGFGFCAGCVLAPVYARREAQLKVAISAPVVFLVAEIVAQIVIAPGSSGHATVLSVLEGTLLALAEVAPWLFAGTAVCIVIAMFRGLPQCVRDLRTGSAVRSASRSGLGVPADAALRRQRS
jgi:hypothetical protein